MSRHQKNFLMSFASTLRGRLILLICVAALPAMLFTVYIAAQDRATALERTKDEARYFTNLISREHLYQIAGAKHLLHWLADEIEKDRSSRFVQDRQFLASLLAGYPQLGNVAILTANGDVVNSAFPLPGKINMARYGAIQRALKSTDSEAGVYVIGPIVKRPLFHLSRAVRDAQGKVRWVVFVAIDLEWLKHITEKVELPEKHILLIVDRNGTVLATSGRGTSESYPVGTVVPELSGQRRGGKAMIQVRNAARMRVFAVAPMEDVPGILIATALPYEHIYDRANAIFYRMFGLLSLLTLCTAGCVIFLEEVTLLRWLRALASVSRKLCEGDYSVRVPVRNGGGEIENMARTFNLMAETLTRRHQELEDAHSRLDKLTRHLQIAREEEAERIARDLHDEVGQVLTSIKMDLARISRSSDEQVAAAAQEELAAIKEKIDGLVEFIRRIASELRPPVLDRMGLASAVALLARNTEQNSNLVIDVETSKLEEPLDWLISITIYRIVQESLTNIARHSGATEAHILCCGKGSEIELTVSDNGRGLCLAGLSGDTFGIIGMQERAKLVGGSFSLESEPGKGTTVRVTIPQNRLGD